MPHAAQHAPPLTRFVLLLALLWLTWRASVGLVSVIDTARACDGAWFASVLGNSEEQRIERTLGQADRKLGCPRGYHDALFRALVEHVAPATTVLVDVRAERRKVQVVATLGTLGYPRLLRVRGANEPVTPAPKHIDHALVFGSESKAEFEASFTLLVRGTDWTLWERKGLEHGAR